MLSATVLSMSVGECGDTSVRVVHIAEVSKGRPASDGTEIAAIAHRLHQNAQCPQFFGDMCADRKTVPSLIIHLFIYYFL